jgi:hypothetical protein
MFDDYMSMAFLHEHLKALCQETDSCCPHWPDEKIVEDLFYLDAKDGGSRVQEYTKRCHQPEIIIKLPCTPEDKISFNMICRPYVTSSEKCSFKNAKALHLFAEEYLEMYNYKDGNNETL